MGYYTRYSGDVTGPAELLTQFQEDADNGATFGEYNLPLSDWIEGEFNGGEPMKWYGFGWGMVAVSKKYPALLFSIEGEGEESGDIWKAWARNGRTAEARAKIVFVTPDLDKLIPSPDVEKMIEEARAAKKAEIDAKIANLEKEREALDG